MLLVVQHPVADLRSFIGAEARVLARPGWPKPDTQLDYVRGAGRVRRRPRGGVKEWDGEDVFADASRALRFGNQLGLQVFDVLGKTAQVHSSFRRFITNGRAGRFEIGLDLLTQSRDYLDIAVRMAQIPVRLRTGQSLKLIDAGRRLAAQLLDASTRHATPKQSQALLPEAERTLPSTHHRWWVAAGNPMLLVEFAPAEHAEVMPEAAVPVDVQVSDTKLWHAWIRLGDAEYGTWLIERGKNENATRRLRINLSRLHAERECLRLVLQAMAAGTRLALTPANSDDIQRYLNDAVKSLRTPTKMGIEQSPILEASMAALGIVETGAATSLNAMRRQVRGKVETYIQQQKDIAMRPIHQGDNYNVTTHVGNMGAGAQLNIVTAKQIENAFNGAFQMVKDAKGTSDEAKAKLDELLKQVQLLVPELPDETKAHVLADMETLTKEATSATPRKKFLELSGEGLIDAAKTVAKMVPSITAAVTGLLALFA